MKKLLAMLLVIFMILGTFTSCFFNDSSKGDVEQEENDEKKDEDKNQDNDNNDYEGYEGNESNAGSQNESQNESQKDFVTEDVTNAISSGNLQFELLANGKGYSVVGMGTCSDANIVIPNTYEGLPVLRIGKNAFSKYTSIKSVVISDSVTSIDEYAFSECSGLERVTIGNSVDSIGVHAFSKCSIRSVIIPDSVTNIDGHAFSDCSKLTNISIGNGVMHIADNAFIGTGYEKNESNWENSVLYIGKYLIDTTKGLPLKYTIKAGTKVIADYAFTYQEIESVMIPNSVNSIGNRAFRSCSALTSVVIPDGVTVIGNEAFAECLSLTSVSIGNGVTSLGNEAFKSCGKLKSIVIPESVMSIGESAFEGCELESADFKNTSGWCGSKPYDGANVVSILANELSELSKAANSLTDDYVDYVWTRTVV